MDNKSSNLVALLRACDSSACRSGAEVIERLRALVAEQQRNCSCPYGDCSTCERAKAALSGDSSAPETPAPQAPIAWVVVADNGGIEASGSYAPGLPPGQHDLYCEPEKVAPYLRSPQETSVTPNECQNLRCRQTGKCVGTLPCTRVHPPGGFGENGKGDA